MNTRKDGVYWAPFIWITQSFINEPNGTVNENNVFALFSFRCSIRLFGSWLFFHISSNCYFTSLNLKLKVHHENEWRQQQMREKKISSQIILKGTSCSLITFSFVSLWSKCIFFFLFVHFVGFAFGFFFPHFILR